MRIISLLCAAILSAGLALAQASKPSPLSKSNSSICRSSSCRLSRARTQPQSRAPSPTISWAWRPTATCMTEVKSSSLCTRTAERHAYLRFLYVVKLNDELRRRHLQPDRPREHPRYRHMADTWAKVAGRWKLKFRQFTPNLWTVNDPN